MSFFARLLQGAYLPAARRYSIVIGAVALALAASELLRPIIELNPFLLFYAAVAFSAWYAGLIGGLLATLLSAATASYFFIAPFYGFSLDAATISRTALFLLVASLISALSESRRRAEQRAHQQSAQLQTLLASTNDAVGAVDQALKRTARLAHISSALSDLLDYSATLQQVADFIVPDLADWCVVDMVGDDGAIVLVAVAHVDPVKVAWAHELRRLYPIDLDGPVGTPNVLRSGQPELYPEIPDSLLQSVARSAEELAILRAVGYHAVMIVPMRARGRIIGTISFVTAESARCYSSDDLAFAQEVAERAAVAIDNARLYTAALAARAQAERVAAQLQRLQAVTIALGAALTPAEVGEVVIREGLAAVGADAGAIFLLVDDGQVFEALSFLGYPDALVPSHVRVSVEAPGPLRDAIESRAIITVESPEALVARWPHLADSQAQSGDAAIAAVPLLLDQKALGVFHAAFRQPRSFQPEDRALLQALARQCAQALERARLLEAERLARAEAEAAVELRGQFLTVASHELKTPLTSLLMQAQLLQRRAARAGSYDPRDLRAFQVVADQARRLDRLINGLLDLSRLDRGQLTITRAVFDLDDLVRRVIGEIQPTSEVHMIVYHGPESAMSIDGDELRIEQVLQNLIGNAIKYSPQSSEVFVRLDAEGSMARLAVTDQGIGIPQQALASLFTRFYRASNADPHQISGMGIGLYVVKEILSLHGGSVSVASAEGAGSTFTILLPQTTTLAEAESIAASLDGARSYIGEEQR